MSIGLIFCLVLGVVGSQASVLWPADELGSLYTGYQGEYAKKYDNYQKSYAFEYGVSDPHTGDHKNQWETKDKEGTVRGSYSLLEPDGTTRIVDYIADEHGFRAVVKKVGIHGTTVETHGGAEAHPETNIALAHIEPQPITIEQPIAYKSYDGGYEDYSGLKNIVADVYAKPVEYVHAPKAELVINVPEYQSEYPSSYSEQTPLYPKADGLKIALPEEYWAQPEEKYVLPQEYHITPKRIQEYIIPEYKLPQEYHAPVPAPIAAQPIEYHVPVELPKEYLPVAKTGAYSYVQENRYNTPKGTGVLVEAPKVAYEVPEKQTIWVSKPQEIWAAKPQEIWAAKPQEIWAPKPQEIWAPKQEIWAPAPISSAQYNLNVDYHH